MWLAALLWACGTSGDPQLRGVSEAVRAWDRGAELLEAGDPGGARAAFAEARTHRPGDALLGAWEARAAAADGDLDGAIALLDAVLAEAPDLAQARYNRAAYLARAGRADEAAADLRRAVDDGAARSRDVLSDPDFSGLLQHEAFGFLPRAVLEVAVDAPEATVFWGSEASVRLRAAPVAAEVLQVGAVRTSGPAELVAVTEDAVRTSEGPGRDVTYALRVTGAGAVSLGPIQISSGGHEATLDPVVFATAAPPDRAPPAEQPVDLTTPSALRAGAELPFARHHRGGLLVGAQVADRVELVPPPADPPILYTYRVSGQTEWTIASYPGVQVERVRVLRAGAAVFDAAPARD